jgi:hypothetical protein
VKSTTLVVLVILIALFAWISPKILSKSRQADGSTSSREASGTALSNTYLGLRNQMLQASRAKLGLPATSKPTEPWGVLMDWGVPKGTATVVAMSDGSASVYLSSGGGFLGGIGHENVRKAAQATVAAANEAQPQMHLTTTYPLPQRGEVIFYVLTDTGVFTASASEADLKSDHNPLSKLGNAAQDVITQYRLMQPTK